VAKKQLRIGIIGTGMIADRHAKEYLKMDNAAITAAADLDGARVKAFAKTHGITKTCTDWKELLEQDNVDAVSVCLPVHLHAPATIDALEAGKHVLCEKPMARNGSEGQAMVDAEKRSGKKLMVYYRRRFSTSARRAKEMIDSGELGRIYYSKFVFHRWRGRPGFDMPEFGAWFMKKELAGGGIMMDMGGYSLDLILGLLNFPKIKSVCAAMYREIDQEKAGAAGVDVEDLAVGMVRLADGGTIWLDTAFAVNVDEPNCELIFGTEAGLRLTPLTLYKHFWFKGNAPTAIEIPVPRDPHEIGCLTAQETFVDCCLQNKAIPISSGEEALQVTKVQDAFYKSTEAGKEIPFDE
jgi:predicted dehydrogenase